VSVRIKSAPDHKPKADLAALSVSERVLLFCLASGTAWQKAGVTEKTALAMVIKGMVDRDTSGHLSLTKKGRDTLLALIGE